MELFWLNCSFFFPVPRLLLMLGEKELTSPNFNIENQAHRQAILFELDRVKTLGIKPPQYLWEYKAVNAGKSLPPIRFEELPSTHTLLPVPV